MSNLRKTLRALQHSEEWREMIEAAAMIAGKEVTRDLQVQTTFAWIAIPLRPQNTTTNKG